MKKVLFLPLLLITLLLGGCWDMVEINDRFCIRCMGLDAGSEPGLIRVTYQMMTPGTDGQVGYDSFTLQAPTLSDAADRFATQAEGKAHFEHLAAVVIGEKLAKEMGHELLDYFYRAPQIRRNAELVTVEGTAQALLTGPLAQEGMGEYLENVLKTFDARGQYTSLSSAMSRIFVKQLNRESYYLMRLSYQPSSRPDTQSPAQSLQVDGATAFTQHGYAGELTLEELETQRLLSGVSRSNVITVPRVGDQNQAFSFRLDDMRVTMRCEIVEGRPYYHMHLKAQCLLTESARDGRYSQESFAWAAEEAVSRALEERVERLLQSERKIGVELAGRTRLARQYWPVWYETLEDPAGYCLECERHLSIAITYLSGDVTP